MRPSDIVLDAIAEMVAAEPRGNEKAVRLGLESIVVAFCTDSGHSPDEVRAELETRIHLFRVNQRKLKLISGGLSPMVMRSDSLQ